MPAEPVAAQPPPSAALKQPAAPPAAAPIAGDSPAMRALIRDVIASDKKNADEQKKKDLEANGFKVASDLALTTRWNVGLSGNAGFMAESPNKDFILHLGGRFQLDTVFFHTQPALTPSTGILEDGMFFRRVRIQFDGTAYEMFEWNLEYALEQVQQGVPNLDEFWVGMKNLPILGSVRIGHNKVPQGFEGDLVSSSKAMTFMERSAYTDAFYQNFATGVWAGNSVLDQRATWAAMWYRQDNAIHGNNGDDFGDGNYGVSGRLTALPVYEDDGRCWLHLGASATYRAGERPDPGITGASLVRLRARPQMRDAIGDFGSTTVTSIVPPATTTLPGNTVRWVDTGNIVAQGISVVGFEACLVRGPFSVQSEWALAMPSSAGNPLFHGGYAQVSYFLTGENRTYDRRLGREGTTYMSGPNTIFWATRDEDGGWSLGRGAWELAYRYNYLSLNSGPILGGQLEGHEVGVNWYLTPTIKIQFEYLHEYRYNRSGANPPGFMDGFGTRVQVFF
jgi:phosphate-selective porin OprO/OprP